MEQAEPTSPLAAHFRAGDGRVLLEQQPDSPGGQQEADHPDLVVVADEVPVVVQDSRNDAGRPVGRRGDHPSAGRVLLVDRQRVEGHPLHRPERISLITSGGQLFAQRGGAPPHLEPSGQDTGGLGAALDALLHYRPDMQQAVTNLRLAVPGQFVGQHDVADPHARLARPGQQFRAGGKRIPDGSAVLDDDWVAGFVLVEDEAAAHRVVLPSAELVTAGIQRPEQHAVTVKLQSLAPVQHDVVVHRERDGVLARQPELSLRADGGDAGFGRNRGDAVGLLALEAENNGLDAAVPVPGRAE